MGALSGSRAPYGDEYKGLTSPIAPSDSWRGFKALADNGAHYYLPSQPYRNIVTKVDKEIGSIVRSGIKTAISGAMQPVEPLAAPTRYKARLPLGRALEGADYVC